MIPIRGSSTIKSAGYNSADRDLHILFHSGGHFVYHGVTPSLYYGFLGAPSKGKFFHANIKKQHKFTKQTSE
jgi:KTSC domain-containing protein